MVVDALAVLHLERVLLELQGPASELALMVVVPKPGNRNLVGVDDEGVKMAGEIIAPLAKSTEHRVHLEIGDGEAFPLLLGDGAGPITYDHVLAVSLLLESGAEPVLAGVSVYLERLAHVGPGENWGRGEPSLHLLERRLALRRPRRRGLACCRRLPLQEGSNEIRVPFDKLPVPVAKAEPAHHLLLIGGARACADRLVLARIHADACTTHNVPEEVEKLPEDLALRAVEGDLAK